MNHDTDAIAIADLVTHARLATLGMLVAGFAHEINTPLGALSSNHDVLQRALGKLQQILEDEVVEPHELEEVRRVVRAVNGILEVNDLAMHRMTQLVRNLRNFGRLDRADVDWADLAEGIDSTLTILAHELRSLHLVREIGVLPRVHCHPDRLNQVWMNLLLNARRATADGGTLTIRARSDGDRVIVEIGDTGSGIPHEHLERIFQPGFTTKEGRVGMGLGLLIARQIVEQHSGSIRVSSELGIGTTFTIELPVVAIPLRNPEDSNPEDS
jgi:two-component system, NtrC family, sensor kinase